MSVLHPPSVADARRFLGLIAHPGDVLELRGLVRVNGQSHVTSGYFDDIGALAEAAIARSGKDDGVYVTINPVLPALLARAPRNKVHRAGSGDTTSDRDVSVRHSLLVDIDPVRPAGISSSDAEQELALALARRVRADMAGRGWPDPIYASSGNGAHLLYAVDLPIDDGGLVRRILARLSAIYSTAEVKIDERVYNAARISKVYGTLTRKGEDTIDRPHRVARILEAPDPRIVVARSLLEGFAPLADKPRNGRAIGYTAERAEFRIDAWIAEHLPDADERPWAEGRRWIVPVCPFEASHDRGEAYICELASGAIAAGCQHESCRWGWRDLRARLEPDAYPSHGGGGRNGRVSYREDPPEVIYADASYDGYVEEICEVGDEEPADPDTESPGTAGTASTHPWLRAPDLVEAIWSQRDQPWIDLRLGEDLLVKVRAGGIAVVMGGPGSGKSSLVANLLVDHARNYGPAIALSIELPADEMGARIVGFQCDASWEDALCGRVQHEFMTEALALPRLYVLERKCATLENLAACVDAARAEYPGEPVLSAVDYAQLASSSEREARLRVADVFARCDDVARDKRIAMIAVSQMARGAAKAAREGERIGADSADLGAESAAIERFATVTLSIGKAGEPREDGSREVELSVGKARMGIGDRVLPMTYWGRCGRWRVTGVARSATELRRERTDERETMTNMTLELALSARAQGSPTPLSREKLIEGIAGRKQSKLEALARLIARGDLVEVARRSPRSRSWMIWTPDRTVDAGIPLIRDMANGGRD